MMYYLVIVDDNQLLLAEKAYPATEKGRKRMRDMADYLRRYCISYTLFFGNEVI